MRRAQQNSTNLSLGLRGFPIEHYPLTMCTQIHNKNITKTRRNRNFRRTKYFKKSHKNKNSNIDGVRLPYMAQNRLTFVCDAKSHLQSKFELSSLLQTRAISN